MAGTSRKRPAAPARSRQRLDVEERRAQLVALGISLFANRSYEAISIEELAQAAGISKGLLYHYFPTKHDYYVAALTHAARQLLDQTLTPSDLPTETRLQQGMEAYLGFVERHGASYVALIRGGLGADPEVAEVLDRTRGVFVSRILENIPAPMVTPLLRLALRGWVGFVEAVAVEWVTRRSGPRARVTEILTSVLAATLRTVANVSLE